MHRVTLIALLFLAACTVDELQLEGRWCNPDYPCASGYSCVDNQCTASSVDAPGPATEARPEGSPADQGSDSPVTDAPRPGPDGDLISPVDMSPDLPVFDLGCPAGRTPCGGLCVDLLTDLNHCGSCTVACGLESDRCENGNCQCDHLKPICTGGLSCVNAKCVCVAGPQSLCNGCCVSSTQCAPGTAVTACGQQPNLCSACSTTNPCLTPTCDPVLRTCSTVAKANGSSCALGNNIGRCFTGGCCTGCWSATNAMCLSGTAITACGSGGNPCLACATGYFCSAGKCILSAP